MPPEVSSMTHGSTDLPAGLRTECSQLRAPSACRGTQVCSGSGRGRTARLLPTRPPGLFPKGLGEEPGHSPASVMAATPPTQPARPVLKCFQQRGLPDPDDSASGAGFLSSPIRRWRLRPGKGKELPRAYGAVALPFPDPHAFRGPPRPGRSGAGWGRRGRV